VALLPEAPLSQGVIADLLLHPLGECLQRIRRRYDVMMM